MKIFLKKGFFLIEVSITLMITGILLFAFVSTFSNALKGAKKGSNIALSDKCENCPDKEGNEICKVCGQVFGTQEGVGGISVTDARILAFPVRTLKGVFGWITCPLVLDRYKRDLNISGNKVDWSIKDLKDIEAIIHSQSNLKTVFKENGEEKKYVYIEDLQLEAKENDELVQNITEEITKALPDDSSYEGIKGKLGNDLVIVSDNVFRDLVSLTTEVVTRIRIDPKTGTVQTGGLWSEEYLPTDTTVSYTHLTLPTN